MTGGHCSVSPASLQFYWLPAAPVTAWSLGQTVQQWCRSAHCRRHRLSPVQPHTLHRTRPPGSGGRRGNIRLKPRVTTKILPTAAGAGRAIPAVPHRAHGRVSRWQDHRYLPQHSFTRNWVSDGKEFQRQSHSLQARVFDIDFSCTVDIFSHAFYLVIIKFDRVTIR